MAGNMARLERAHNSCLALHKKKYEGELVTLERFRAICQAQGGVCVEAECESLVAV